MTIQRRFNPSRRNKKISDKSPDLIRKISRVRINKTKVSREKEIIKKQQMEILELKNSMNKMKNAIKSIYKRRDQMED